MKKKYIMLCLCALLAITIFIQSAPPAPPVPLPPPPTYVRAYEEQPPTPMHFWVKKLPHTRTDSTNLVMRIQYDDDTSITMPDTLVVYVGRKHITFRDDGSSPDSLTHDRVYNAFIKEDTVAFMNEMVHLDTTMGNKGQWIKFTGHVGEMITTLPSFDLKTFQTGGWAEIDNFLINATDCGPDLLKQNSLFITDLSVVEDPTRTFDPSVNTSYTGTPMGAWTFGTLIKNIVNTPVTGVSCKDFLEDWLKTFTNQQTVNSYAIDPRTDIRFHVIAQWINRCDPSITVDLNPLDGVDAWTAAWESSTVTEADILKYAPFRLTAIVNRIDLRGNSAYNGSITDAGETRFIFTLVNLNGSALPIQTNQGNSSPGFIDWTGMNIILEYGNTPTSACGVQSLAQQWLDLSALPLDGGDFNDQLQDITDQVTTAGANPNGINESALRSLRTNERINEYIPGGGNDVVKWHNSNWELRQFALDGGTGELVQVPVTNSPYFKINCMTSNNYSLWPALDWRFEFCSADATYSGDPNESTYNTYYSALGNWLVSHRYGVQSGNFNIPPTIGSNPILGGSAIVRAEYLHFFNVEWPGTIVGPIDKAKVRQQYSLNTCQGCHSGETETIFTHVRPLGYGESADYWSSGGPDYTNGMLDTRFDGENIGNYAPLGAKTVTGSFPSTAGTPMYGNYPNVSAFLTGRNYKTVFDAATSTTSDTYDDDDPSDADDDNTDGLFYVNDPTNTYTSGVPAATNKRWGYNDLERRKQDLCTLVNHNCNSSSIVVDIIAVTSFQPFPVYGH